MKEFIGQCPNNFMRRLDRCCGYALFVLIFLCFLSGHGQTKQFMSPEFSKILHVKWLPIPTCVAFLLHAFINIRFMLMRKRVGSIGWWSVCLTISGILLFAAFLYIHFR